MSERKLIFKNGDRVFHFASGWGRVIECDAESYFSPYYINWDCGNKGYCSEDYLSFTEYRIEGISQERTEDLPDRGDIVWIKNTDDTNWFIGHFWQKENEYYCVSPNNQGDNLSCWDEMTIENPYKK